MPNVSVVVYSEYVLWLDGGVVEYPEDLVAVDHSVLAGTSGI